MLDDPIGVSSLSILAALIVALYILRKALALLASRQAQAPSGAHPQRHRRLLLEATEILLAAIFFLVGGAKLVGRRDMILLFQEIGVGQWLRYLTGTIEVAAATLLVTPLLSGVAALSLGAVMIVASLVELFVLHRPPVAALACLTGHAFVAWSRVSRSRQGLSSPVMAPRSEKGAPLNALRARWAFPRRALSHDPHRRASRGPTQDSSRFTVGRGRAAQVPTRAHT